MQAPIDETDLVERRAAHPVRLALPMRADEDICQTTVRAVRSELEQLVGGLANRQASSIATWSSTLVPFRSSAC